MGILVGWIKSTKLIVQKAVLPTVNYVPGANRQGKRIKNMFLIQKPKNSTTGKKEQYMVNQGGDSKLNLFEVNKILSCIVVLLIGIRMLKIKIRSFSPLRYLNRGIRKVEYIRS
jgi:hypothetical protein